MTMGIIRVIGRLLYPWPLNCRNCGNATDGEDMLCVKCRRKLKDEMPLRGFGGDKFAKSAAAHHYTAMARDMVMSLKYNSMSALAGEMAKDMINAAGNAGFEQPDIIAYVPMHAVRRRQKYFDQAEVLARLVAAHWHRKNDKVLKRVKQCKQQARVRGFEARAQNVKDAFAVSGSVEGMHVLLIDDVYTTGATSRECARMLRQAGAVQVDLLVYAVAGAGTDIYEIKE